MIGGQFTVSAQKRSGCGTLPEKGLPKGPTLTLATTSRAYLDVMLDRGTELFSWPGEYHFDTWDPDDLLGGGLAGSGDYANYLINVFDSDNVTFEFLGACPKKVPNCARGFLCTVFRK